MSDLTKQARDPVDLDSNDVNSSGADGTLDSCIWGDQCSSPTASPTQGSLRSQIQETIQLRSVLSRLNLPVLTLNSALLLLSFNAKAGAVFGIDGCDLGTKLSSLEGVAPSHDLERVCKSGESAERSTLEPNGKDWLCHMLPYASSAGATWGVMVILELTSPSVLADKPSAPAGLLTLRQQQVMELVLSGSPNKNVAADLGISQRTVENHRAAIMRRIGAKSLPALARIAMGLARSDDFK
jgi:DNA-binding CsgD family transcriptional regulator